MACYGMAHVSLLGWLLPARAGPSQPHLPTPASPAVRTFDQRSVLDMFSGRITAVSLSGYLFFGRQGGWGEVGAMENSLTGL